MNDLQELCERGQEELMATEYLLAEELLARAERIAWERRDWDTLARLYMPLQEARRQIRQRCLEGPVNYSIDNKLSAAQIVEKYPSGTIVVVGPAKAMMVRQLARERQRFLDVFIGRQIDADEATASLAPNPPHPLEVLPTADSSAGIPLETNALPMHIWEELHLPFLKAADAEKDPVKRIEKYRHTIEVDYACELAHQNLSNVAHELARLRNDARSEDSASERSGSCRD